MKGEVERKLSQWKKESKEKLRAKAEREQKKLARQREAEQREAEQKEVEKRDRRVVVVGGTPRRGCKGDRR